jgi:hypothetical protein
LNHFSLRRIRTRFVTPPGGSRQTCAATRGSQSARTAP